MTQLPLDSQWLLHRPITGPRAGHIGENVFCEKWLELMQSEVEFREVDEPEHLTKLNRILRNADFAACTDRACAIAASWATYLGCNVGASVLSLGESLRQAGFVHDCYLLAWASHNRRAYGVNNGFRAIEFFLAPADHYGRSYTGGVELKRIPDLCVLDYEIIEHLWSWLGSDDGGAWLAGCQREIERRQAAAWRSEREQNNGVVEQRNL